MSSANMTITKPSMYFDPTFPFAGLKNSTVNTDDTKKCDYPEVVVICDDQVEKVAETPTKKKKYMWTSMLEFFKQQQKFQRNPCVFTPI